MTSFLSYFHVTKNTNIPFFNGMLCPIPNKCKNCRFYLSEQCASSVGFSMCRYGYSVYYDLGRQTIFFGMRVVGLYDKKRVTRKKVMICLTQQQVIRLVNYDLMKVKESHVNEMVQGFSTSFDKYVKDLKLLLPRWDNDTDVVISIPAKSIGAIRSQVEQLDDLKRETERLLSKHVPFQLFTSGDSNAVFTPEEICGKCTKHECQGMSTTQGFSCKICPNGCAVCSFQHILFYGLRVDGYYIKRCCLSSVGAKDIPTFTEPLIHELICLTVSQNDWIFIIRKFLHDVGQYVFGITNMLPLVRTGSPVTISTTTLKSIKAFVSALKALKRAFFIEISGRGYQERRNFEPFPLFFKYQLCFASQDVKIDIQDKDPNAKRGIHETVEGPIGFEFVILNILSNAVKYLPLGPDERKITIIFEKNKDGLSIRVTSLGPYLTKEELRHLGERGFRGFVAKKRRKSGQGLGLSSIMEYINAARYVIRFESDDVFTFHDGDKYSNFSVHITIPQRFCRGKKSMI